MNKYIIIIITIITRLQTQLAKLAATNPRAPAWNATQQGKEKKKTKDIKIEKIN